jgi:hypothetical protein
MTLDCSLQPPGQHKTSNVSPELWGTVGWGGVGEWGANQIREGTWIKASRHGSRPHDMDQGLMFLWPILLCIPGSSEALFILRDKHFLGCHSQGERPPLPST